MEKTIKKPEMEEIKFARFGDVHVAVIKNTPVSNPGFSSGRILADNGLVKPLFPGILHTIVNDRELLNALRGRTFAVQPEQDMAINDGDYRGRYRLKKGGGIERGGIISENTIVMFGGKGRWLLKIMGDGMTRLYEARFEVSREFVISEDETTHRKVDTIVGIRRG